MPGEPSPKKYESWELRPKMFLIALAGLAVVMCVLGFALVQFYEHLMHSAGENSSPRSVVQSHPLPGDVPPLQPQTGHEMVDAQDLAQMREREGKIFDTLGWKWDESAQRRTVPTAVLEALRHRRAATQPGGVTSAERGAK